MAEPNLITAVELVLWWRQNLSEHNVVNSEHEILYSEITVTSS